MNICALCLQQIFIAYFMPQAKNNRIVHESSVFTDFKLVGVKGIFLEQVRLSLDEFEAIRLADHIGLSHEEAAGRMGISRPTFLAVLAFLIIPTALSSMFSKSSTTRIIVGFVLGAVVSTFGFYFYRIMDVPVALLIILM